MKGQKRRERRYVYNVFFPSEAAASSQVCSQVFFLFLPRHKLQVLFLLLLLFFFAEISFGAELMRLLPPRFSLLLGRHSSIDALTLTRCRLFSPHYETEKSQGDTDRLGLE